MTLCAWHIYRHAFGRGRLFGVVVDGAGRTLITVYSTCTVYGIVCKMELLWYVSPTLQKRDEQRPKPTRTPPIELDVFQISFDQWGVSWAEIGNAPKEVLKVST